MKRGIIILLFAALSTGVVAAALVYKNRQAAQQVRKQEPATSLPQEPAVTQPSADPAIAAQREIACVDQVLAGAVPEGTDVNKMLAECERNTEEALKNSERRQQEPATQAAPPSGSSQPEER